MGNTDLTKIMLFFIQGEKDPETEKAEADSEEKEQGDNKDGKSVPPHR